MPDDNLRFDDIDGMHDRRLRMDDHWPLQISQSCISRTYKRCWKLFLINFRGSHRCCADVGQQSTTFRAPVPSIDVTTALLSAEAPSFRALYISLGSRPGMLHLEVIADTSAFASIVSEVIGGLLISIILFDRFALMI